MMQKKTASPKAIHKRKVIMVGAALFNWSETQRMIEISLEMHRRGYQVVFLGEGKYEHLLQNMPFVREKLSADRQWYTPERIQKIFDMDYTGNAYASQQEIEAVVDQELTLIRRYQPEAIVTGYRMTLTASARIAQVKLVWCLSAVLSTSYLRQAMQRTACLEQYKKDKSAVTYRQVRALYDDRLAWSRLFNSCATSAEWNRCLVKKGAEPFACDMEIYRGDLNLMSDAKELFPDVEEKALQFMFMGPVFNSEQITMPPVVGEVWEDPAKKQKKKVLVSVGSGGNKELFRRILHALKAFDFEFFISVIDILDEEELKDFPETFHFCEKFPLVAIADLCDAAVIQGGQGTLYAVIAGNCPFLSIPATYEQRHNVENLLRFATCGQILYPYETTENNIVNALSALVSKSDYTQGMQMVHNTVEKYYCDARCKAEKTAADLIEKIISLEQTHPLGETHYAEDIAD